MFNWFKRLKPFRPFGGERAMYLRLRRPAGHQKIDAIHCYIATHRSGDEEILFSAGAGKRFGSGMSVRRDGVDVSEEDLSRILQQMAQSDDPIEYFRLVSFLPVKALD